MSKKVLIVHPGPEFSVADVLRGWEGALRELGCEVGTYNSNDRLTFYLKALIDTGTRDEDGLPVVRQAMSTEEAFTAAMQGLTHACYTFWPDVVLFISGFFLQAGMLEVLRTRRHKLVMFHTESPYQETEQLTRAPFVDLNVLNDPTNLGAYKQLGPALYLPHAYDPAVHFPRSPGTARDPELASDLAFIGTGFKSRVEFLEKMDLSGVDFLLGGSSWIHQTTEDSPLRKFLDTDGDPDDCVLNTDAANLYRNAKLGINVYRRESEEEHAGEGWAMGPREVEMAACGLPYLRDPRGENEQVLPMLPAFEGPEHASDVLRWWLSHDAERERAGRLALDAVRDRTFASHARVLLREIDKL